MATLVKTPAGTWKALIRKQGWPTTTKVFRIKRDAEDWARRTEDEMMRGVFIQRTLSEKTTLAVAITRYLADITPTKKPTTQRAEHSKSKMLVKYLGKYSLAAITPDIVANYRDKRLAEPCRSGTTSNNTVRLELALLSHLFTVAIQEWGLGLTYNPVLAIRKPNPGQGRDRRLTAQEERKLLSAAKAHSNPMLGWIVTLALETGMRSSEITSLRRNQINLKSRVIRLSDTKNNSARSVPLTLAATAVLTEALDNPIRPIDTDLVFFGEPGHDGKRRPYAFSKVWTTLKTELGISDLRFHDLRHEAISRLVEAGLGDQKVAAISGHKSMGNPPRN